MTATDRTVEKVQSEPARLREKAQEYGKRKTAEDLADTAGVIGKIGLGVAAIALVGLLTGCSGKNGSVAWPQIGPDGLTTQQTVNVKGVSFRRTCTTARRGEGGFTVNCVYEKTDK